jgi:hypothetical protein
VAGRYGSRCSWLAGRGGVWYPGGARGDGCLTGEGPEAAVHGKLHVGDEATVRLVAWSHWLAASLADNSNNGG